jgi:acyl-CoA dehydrogenase
MNFDFSDDQKLLKDTASSFLKEHSPLALCRAVLESDDSYSSELWKKAAGLGWQATAIPEEYGGYGFGQLELAMISEEVGYALAPIPFASSVCFASDALVIAGSEEQKKRWLPKLASGEAIGTFALAEGPGDNGSGTSATKLDADSLTGTKVPVLDGDYADIAVVLAESSNGPTLALVELAAAGVERTKLECIDPSRSVARLDFTNSPAEPLGAPGEGGKLAEALLDRAAVLMAFEQIGSATRALEITKKYTLERYAFGRPIGSFQALKHRMADRYCDIEIGRSNSYYGAWALENDDPELAVSACLARVAASEALDQMGIDMIQLHGGVGFTWEFDCHLFYRRSKLLSSALGSTASWKRKLIRRVSAQEAA